MTIKSNSWHSYPKPLALGHKVTMNIFDDEVVIEEKIDGSQFSFGNYGGELQVRSRGQQINLEAPEGMFLLGINYVKKLHAEDMLRDGLMYTGEYLNKPKHNVQAYSRTPKNNIVLFDVRYGNEQYLNKQQVLEEAERLDLEVAPVLFQGKITDPAVLEQYMEGESLLGGPKEGIVVKNYVKYGMASKALMAKIVSDKFKEKHKKTWKSDNPGHNDVLTNLKIVYRAEARWAKAAQHMAEAGILKSTPSDIGPLVREIQEDIKTECEEEIKDTLFKWAWPHIARAAVNGAPQWYKERLADNLLAQMSPSDDQLQSTTTGK